MNNFNALNLDIAEAAVGGGDEKYVIFNLAESLFAVKCKYVVSIEKSTQITEMANAPPGVRGVGYYKDEAINIFDLRILFGYPSHEYYVEREINIGGHIMDHEAWAEQIKAGGAENLERDPSECGLGKWLAGYKTDNMAVQNLIKRIGPVHEQFHRLADKALAADTDNREEMDKLAAETDAVRDELVSGLSELREAILMQAKELPIVLKAGGKRVGILVDDVESVDEIEEIQDLPPAAMAAEYIKKLGFRTRDKHITLILEADLFG